MFDNQAMIYSCIIISAYTGCPKKAERRILSIYTLQAKSVILFYITR